MKHSTIRGVPRNAAPLRSRLRLGPKDVEASIYPLIQREAATSAPANCWTITMSPEDALEVSPQLMARFAYDAIEHYSLGDPRLGENYASELLVIAADDPKLKPGKLNVYASTLSASQLASERAKATVTNRAIFSKKDQMGEHEPTLYSPTASPDLMKEGKAMGIKNLLSSLNGKNKTGGSKVTSKWVSPDEIIQNTLTEIDDKAMSWPDGKDLPDRVLVYLSQADYVRYGPRKRTSEQHIEAKILDYAQECGALLECDPSVTIKVDPMLYAGQMRIDVSFSDPKAPHENEAVAARKPRTATTQASHPQASQARRTNTRENPHATPEFKPASAMRTPAFGQDGTDNSIAKLMGSSFQSAVLPNDSIGRHRYHDRPRPNIVLNGPDFEFVSQEQGVFEHDRDGWWFTSTGRNGTSIQRKGSWTKLPDGHRFALEDGDDISFAKCPPLTFSIAQ